MLKLTETNGFNTPSNQTDSKLNNPRLPSDKKIEETAKLNLDQKTTLNTLQNNLWSKISNDDDDLFEMPSPNDSGSAGNHSELEEESDDSNLVFYDLEDETSFDLEKSNEFNLNIPEKSTNRELAAVNRAIETPAKIEAAKKGWWDFAADIISKGIQTVASAAASATIKRAADNFAKNLNKGELISHARQSMMLELNDPLFVAFTDMITHLAWSAIEPKINKRSNDFLGNTLFQHQGTIKDVIEINLAQGFANFAKEIKANRENIPNFDHQPTLVNMISVLLHRSSNHIDAAKLRTIEQKYRKSYLEILDQTKIFCSNIPNYQELIKEYKQSSDPVIRQRIVQALLPGYVKERDQMSTLFLARN